MKYFLNSYLSLFAYLLDLHIKYENNSRSVIILPSYRREGMSSEVYLNTYNYNTDKLVNNYLSLDFLCLQYTQFIYI
jgi:hypothetical protein